MSHFRPRQHNLFQSTPPVRGATELAAAAAIITTISIHAPRAGGDPRNVSTAVRVPTFQSTPPVRGATRKYTPCSYHLRDFNPRPPCGGRPRWRGYCRAYGSYFNPRPPCGGRPLPSRLVFVAFFISIHAPRAGGDNLFHSFMLMYMNFNPRPPCGGRPLTI